MVEVFEPDSTRVLTQQFGQLVKLLLLFTSTVIPGFSFLEILFDEGGFGHTYSVFRAEIKIWSQAPDGCFIPRQTGRLTVGRNIRLRLNRQLSAGARHGQFAAGASRRKQQSSWQE
jgi:hypothetical protein